MISMQKCNYLRSRISNNSKTLQKAFLINGLDLITHYHIFCSELFSILCLDRNRGKDYVFCKSTTPFKHEEPIHHPCGNHWRRDSGWLLDAETINPTQESDDSPVACRHLN